MRRARVLLGLMGLGAAVACGTSTPQGQGLLTPPGSSGSGNGGGSGSEGTSGSSGSNSSGSDFSSGSGSSGGSSNGGSSTGSGSSGSGSSSGSSRSGSSGSSSGSTHKPDAGGGLAGGGTTPTSLPMPKGTCSPLTTGMNMISVNGKAMTWSIWVGQKSSSGSGGPIVIYWHGTGTNGSEVMAGLGQAAITEIQGMGGVVASAETTSSTGTNTGDNVWYTGDFD
ncbi:MAG TPA: hypothetical protein VKU41_10245, partial [Polyangiaceae bacterium]|nr:hypothetical protein [Polyangiaceae bacterium]